MSGAPRRVTSCGRSAGTARELSLELGNLRGALSRWCPYLLADAAARHRVDIVDRRLRLAHRACARFARRRHADHAFCLGIAIRQCVCGAVPQRSAPGADVLMVLRAAGGGAARARDLAEAAA